MKTQNHSGGGSYVIGADGARTLVERTKEAHDQDQQPEQAQPAAQDASAKVSEEDIKADDQKTASNIRRR